MSTIISHFAPNSFYRPADPKLAALAKPQTLRVWRSQDKGPAYLKIGSRVFYTGDALNKWLESRLVEPSAT